jgi:1-acyl-sn-glycerol-3-phosphate acyltransferase
MVYRICRALLRLLLPLQMRLRVRGARRWRRTGALLIISNHLGLLDPLVIASHFPRQIHILAKAEVFEWPVIGGLARLSALVPVRRGASDREAVRALSDWLARGECIMLLPEGTYPKVPLPAAMLRAQPGAAFLALRSGATVLPVAVTGTERVWSPARGWHLWHRPRVTVNFGEPYCPQAPAGVGAKAAYQAVADDMGRRIAALLPEAYRGYYAGAPAAGAASVEALPGLADQQRPGQDAGRK